MVKTISIIGNKEIIVLLLILTNKLFPAQWLFVLQAVFKCGKRQAAVPEEIIHLFRRCPVKVAGAQAEGGEVAAQLAAAEQHKPIAAVNLGRTRADALLALKVELPIGPALAALPD